MIGIFLNILFPKVCLGCKKVGSYLCSDCFSDLPVYKLRCIGCRRGNLLGLTCSICSSKKSLPDACYTLFHYNPLLKKLIKSSKFRAAEKILSEFMQIVEREKADQIRKDLSIIPSNTLIQPVPLHPKRLKERGFNQAQIIAQALGKILGLKVISNLERVKYSPPQSYYRRSKERFLNIRSAFRIKENFLPKNILIVDDLITTGHTLREITRILRRSGVERVFAFTLAGR